MFILPTGEKHQGEQTQKYVTTQSPQVIKGRTGAEALPIWGTGTCSSPFAIYFQTLPPSKGSVLDSFQSLPPDKFLKWDQ